MFTIRLLGGASVEGEAGLLCGRAAHKRRLALLALLAAPAPTMLARERLLALLWPEHPPARGRALLSESLYVLRREMGENVFITAGDEVGLARACVTSDVMEFDRALAAGEWARAAEVYAGPFLDGFFVSDAPEFERWAEAERERYADGYARALEALAEAEETAGRWTAAAGWWRRRAAHDRHSPRVAMRLMRALHAAGERAAALRHAEVHTALLREELGAEPEPEVLALAERLRMEPVSGPAAPAAALPVTVAPVEALRAAESAAVEAATEAVVHAFASHAPPAVAVRAPSAPGRRRVVLLGLITLLVLAAGVAAWGAGADARQGRVPPHYDPARIAVLYFDDYTPQGELGYLANGLTERLIYELSQVDALDVISRNGVKPFRDSALPMDSIAHVLRAGSIVEGSVQRSGERLRVVVKLVDPYTGSELESRTLERPMGELFALQDDLAQEVGFFLRQRLGREIRVREFSLRTKSTEALRAMLRAQEFRDDAEQIEADTSLAAAPTALRLLESADSLLSAAERHDPAWAEPRVARGWVAVQRARLMPDSLRRPILQHAIGHAEYALRGHTSDAAALELRGTARWMLEEFTPPSPHADSLRAAAEHDLREALAQNPAAANAWIILSQLLLYRGERAGAELAARRAFDQDPYLGSGAQVVLRLFWSALERGELQTAGQWCERGRQMKAADWRFVECHLTLLAFADPPNPDSARALITQLNALDPPERARARAGARARLLPDLPPHDARGHPRTSRPARQRPGGARPGARCDTRRPERGRLLPLRRGVRPPPARRAGGGDRGAGHPAPRTTATARLRRPEPALHGAARRSRVRAPRQTMNV